MFEAMSKYFKKLSISMFFVIYMLFLFSKIDIGVGVVNIRLLIQVMIIFALFGLYSIVKDIRGNTIKVGAGGVNKTFNPLFNSVTKLRALTHKVSQIGTSRATETGRISNLQQTCLSTDINTIALKEKESIKPKSWFVIVGLMGLVGICLYILIDVFSPSVTSDYTVLLFIITWVICSQITGLGGKLTILGGIILLCLCPLFVIFKWEAKAEKASIWAFMFFVGGLIQQVKSKDDVSLFSAITDLKKLLIQNQNKVNNDDRFVTSKLKQTNSGLSGLVLDVTNVTWKIYKCLTTEEKELFGSKLVESIDILGRDLNNVVKTNGHIKTKASLIRVEKEINDCRYWIELTKGRVINVSSQCDEIKCIVDEMDKQFLL